MDRKHVLEALQQARTQSPKRKFNQTFDFVINLKGIDVKKENQRINAFVVLPHTRGKKVKITALVGKELLPKAKELCDHTIPVDNFKTLDKKQIAKLSQESDFFIAQANIVPQIASTFGKALGARGKMPSPKAGGIIQPTTTDLAPIIQKLQKTVKVETKNEPTIKAPVGSEAMKDDEIADNILAVYHHVLPLLAQEAQNVKSSLVKLTMGKPAFIGAGEKKVKK